MKRRNFISSLIALILAPGLFAKDDKKKKKEPESPPEENKPNSKAWREKRKKEGKCNWCDRKRGHRGDSHGPEGHKKKKG